MRPGTARRTRLAWEGVIAAAVLLVALLSPMSALAMTNGKVTLNKATGGQQARFIFVAVTDPETSTTSLELEFPSGFDLSKVPTVTVDTLDGIKITHLSTTPKVEGTTVKMDFDPPVEPSKQLRVLIYDVSIPYIGGEYDLGVNYVAGGRELSLEGMQFRFKTPPLPERISLWMDNQPLVQAWREFKFLDLFLRPQLIVQSIFLAFVGWLLSIGLVVVAFPIAIIGGLALAFLKMSKVALIRWPASIYINVIRGTPLFLQIYIAFVGLPIAGFHVQWFVLGFTVLALNSAAYLSEIFRAGIQSINKGQFEAASSLGMTYGQAMRFVIVPQTVKRVLPTMTSEFILLFKDTALLFPVGVFELMMYSNQLVARFGNLTPFVVAAGFYLIVTIPLISWVGTLERKLAISEGGQVDETKKARQQRLAAGAAIDAALLDAADEEARR